MKLRKDIKRGKVTSTLEKIKHLRESKKITQTQMAELIGIHKDTYVNKEIGKTQFTVLELMKLMLILDCKPEDIF